MSTGQRSYQSDSRRAKAELTKKAILDAARKIFSKQGFEKATIDGIAELAGVSAPLIYSHFKSKEGLMRALIDSAVFGADYKVLVEKVITEQNPAEMLRAVARITRYIYEAETRHAGFNHRTAVISAGLRKLEQDLENQRYERQEVVVRRLYESQATRAGLSLQEAHDIVWALTSGDLYRMLVRERKWTAAQYEDWLGELLHKALLG